MSLVPAKQNFTIYEGATFYRRIFFQVDGEVQDLTGYSAKLIIKKEASGQTLLTLTSSDEGITLGESEGTIDIEITDEETSELTWTSGVYELFLTDSTGRTDVLLRGSFKVVPF